MVLGLKQIAQLVGLVAVLCLVVNTGLLVRRETVLAVLECIYAAVIVGAYFASKYLP